jgi:hypothetical protein
MYVMLNRRALARINDRPRGRGTFVYAALGAVVVAAACAFLLSYVIGGAVLLAGGGLAYLLYRRDAEARVVDLHYDLKGEAAARFSVVRAACEALAGAERIWRVEEAPGEPVAGVGGAIPGNEGARLPVEVGRLETPGISANVDVCGIRAGHTSLFFLPEGVLVYEDDRYRAVSYEAFGVVYAPSRVAETGAAPADAEVVGETWRYVTEDGRPDRRRSSNPRYPIVAYGMLALTGLAASAAGLGGPTRAAKSGLRLLVSNKAAAVRFARAFGAGRDEERDRNNAHDTAHEARARRNAEVEIERSGSLFKILGVEPGASQAEISAAYKKQARMYHPDRVATLAPEVREAAEIRMKEINAAYGQLKRRGS